MAQNKYSKDVVSCINNFVKNNWAGKSHIERKELHDHYQNECVGRIGNANDSAILANGGIPYEEYWNVTTSRTDVPLREPLDDIPQIDEGGGATSAIIGIVVIVAVIGGIVWAIKKFRNK